MGLLNVFSKPEETGHLTRLPSGSFTVDVDARVIASTLPRSFPEQHVKEIATHVLNVFRGAKKAELPLTELVINYSALKITARELRGGAIIFLAPETTK
jgi:hypothetical protein